MSMELSNDDVLSMRLYGKDLNDLKFDLVFTDFNKTTIDGVNEYLANNSEYQTKSNPMELVKTVIDNSKTNYSLKFNVFSHKEGRSNQKANYVITYKNNKDNEYRLKMVDVYNEQVKALIKIVPTFKVANATIYFDETSPHMHVIGVPIIENCTRGMKKQVGKTKLFTKTSLTEIQDKMRNACIKSYNKFYDMDFKLKEKQKGRNQDINVKDMSNYREIKKQLAKKEQKLEKANAQTKELDNTSQDINKILGSLKPTLINKNNMIISSEDVQKIKNYTKDVKDITKTVRSVNDLNIAIKDFEHSTFETIREVSSLKYEIELKNKEISSLKRELSTKDKIISKLQTEKEKIKTELQKFKGFWHSIMSHFHKRICYDKDNNYKIVSDDLYKNGIFDDNDNEIANNIYRKVTIPNENKNRKRNNDIRF